MSALLLHRHHRPPTPARSAAAALRGWHPWSWRYRPDSDRLIAAAQEREGGSPERGRACREERLASVRHRAATWSPDDRDGTAATGWQDLGELFRHQPPGTRWEIGDTHDLSSAVVARSQGIRDLV